MTGNSQDGRLRDEGIRRHGGLQRLRKEVLLDSVGEMKLTNYCN